MSRPRKNLPLPVNGPIQRREPKPFPTPSKALAHAEKLLQECGLPASLASGAHSGAHSIAASTAASTSAPIEAQAGGREAHRAADSASTTPAEEWARSGAMYLSGTADGPPEFAAGALATAARGAEVALRALSPGNVFAHLDAPALLGERAAIAGLSRRGDVSCGGAARLLTAQNGVIAVHLPREVDWQSLPAWLEIAADPVWKSESDLHAEPRWRALAEAIQSQDVARLVDRARLLGLAVAEAPRNLPAPEQIGALAHFSHGSEVAPRPTGAFTQIGSDRPLRLLDLSTLWAGPLAADLLAECGIEVLKIESPDRPDGARLGPAAFFDLMHGRKQGCALDLKAPGDRNRFEAILEHADLVIESARPRALSQLGYDAPSWVSAKPGRIWASITGYGRADPGIAFGDDAGVAAGLGWALQENESPAETPTFCGDAVADPLTGMHLAALVLGGLRKGRGGLLDIALRDVAAYSARASQENLVAPRERTAEGWQLRLAEGAVQVAAPRARAAQGQAPPLASISDQALRAWTNPC
ncbi:MAG: CoA transferase [Myxococcota bacterium]